MDKILHETSKQLHATMKTYNEKGIKIRDNPKKTKGKGKGKANFNTKDTEHLCFAKSEDNQNLLGNNISLTHSFTGIQNCCLKSTEVIVNKASNSPPLQTDLIKNSYFCLP